MSPNQKRLQKPNNSPPRKGLGLLTLAAREGHAHFFGLKGSKPRRRATSSTPKHRSTVLQWTKHGGCEKHTENKEAEATKDNHQQSEALCQVALRAPWITRNSFVSLRTNVSEQCHVTGPCDLHNMHWTVN